MNKHFIKTVFAASMLFLFQSVTAQNKADKKTKILVWDGMAVAGYVNHGGFVNFGGPTVKLIQKPFSIGFGILPTMRIKEDKVVKGATKNSAITPTAGFGFTFVYKHLVVQVPFYYNAKTTSSNGKWNPGIGLGFKL